MDQTLKDLASWSIDHAKSAGADACRVRIGGERFVEIEYLERRPENIKEATTRGMGIDIYVNGRFSSQSTSDLRKDALQTFITSAVATTRLLAEDPYRTLPDPKYYEGRASADLQLLDAEYTGLTPERRHDLVKALEAASLEKGGDRIISVEASTYDTHHESIVLTSNGFEGGTEGTVFSMGASVTVKDEGDRRPADGAYVTCRSQKNLPQPTLVGTVAAERALSLLGGKKIDTATLPVIIENQGVPRLLYGLLAGMYGSNIDQQRSFLADKKGHPIASEHLTLIDDPLLPGGLGSRLFDGDGLSARTRTMIDKGILQDFFVDWYLQS